jgi:hypothetical protein
MPSVRRDSAGYRQLCDADRVSPPRTRLLTPRLQVAVVAARRRRRRGRHSDDRLPHGPDHLEGLHLREGPSDSSLGLPASRRRQPKQGTEEMLLGARSGGDGGMHGRMGEHARTCAPSSHEKQYGPVARHLNRASICLLLKTFERRIARFSNTY